MKISRNTLEAFFGWHPQLNGHESEQTPGDGEGKESLACYSPWSCKESDTSKQLDDNIKSVLFLGIEGEQNMTSQNVSLV